MELPHHNQDMRISLIIALFLIPKVGKSQMALPTFQGAQMPHTTIFENLQTLAVSLDALTSITNSNFGSVQSTIEGADGSFHVFAVVGYGYMAESLQGISASGGTTSFSARKFVYNSSASNILSTGNTIANMTGGPNSVIDGNKWMAMALYDGSTNGFKGILLWVFTDDLINNSNSVTTDAHTVTTAKSIFYPSISSGSYHRIYALGIGEDGSVTSSDYDGNVGWNFSNGQQASSSTGYYTTSKFAYDDGGWGFGLSGKKVDGNSGYTPHNNTGFGFGNFNSTDTYGSYIYWNGTQTNTTTYVGFVFTGDM
jgi:hypothetical protein